MSNRILTHADAQKVMCDCLGPLKPLGPVAVLRVNRSPVLLENEVGQIDSSCKTPDNPDKGQVKCRVAQPPLAGRQNLLRVDGQRPVTEKVRGMTTGMRPHPLSYKLKGESSSILRVADAASGGPAGAAIMFTPLDDEARGKKLPPGIYLGARRVGRLPAGVHQFLLVIPEIPEDFKPCLDLGKENQGFVLSAHNSSAESTEPKPNILDSLIKRTNYLVAEINDDGEHSQSPDGGDLTAAKEWISGKAIEKTKWKPVLSSIERSNEFTVDEFAKRLLEATGHYRTNTEKAPVEYPIAGGVFVHLASDWFDLVVAREVAGWPVALIKAAKILHTPKGRCFNSNSWTHGMLQAAGGSLDPEATDLDGLDLCRENAIPAYYFQDNEERITRAEKRRNNVEALMEAGGLENATRALVRAVVDDPAIRNKEEVILEDLRITLLGGEPFLGAEPLNPDVIRGVYRFFLALKAASIGAGSEYLPEEALIAGLFWGYYGPAFGQIFNGAVVIFSGGEGHPQVFQHGSAIGRELANRSLNLNTLADRLQSALNFKGP